MTTVGSRQLTLQNSPEELRTLRSCCAGLAIPSG
jgi:hypothetical protein